MTIKARDALRFDPDRPAVTPKHAATLLAVRDGDEGLEVFCVRRHAKSRFVGGAVVFPGGKLDGADDDEAIVSTRLHPRGEQLAGEGATARGLAICACRESIEEAAILPATPVPRAEAVARFQHELNHHARTFGAMLKQEALTLDLAALVPFGRWVTPEAELRRYDARFFLTRLPEGQAGQHDHRETTSSVWATPTRIIEGFMAGELFIVPPTLRCLELLAPCADVDAALSLAERQTLRPICPRFIPDDPPRLVLPGDPDHPVDQAYVDGPSRFVLRDEKFISESPEP